MFNEMSCAVITSQLSLLPLGKRVSNSAAAKRLQIKVSYRSIQTRVSTYFGAQNGNLEELVYFLKAKHGYKR
jgi:hypothetical protein